MEVCFVFVPSLFQQNRPFGIDFGRQDDLATAETSIGVYWAFWHDSTTGSTTGSTTDSTTRNDSCGMCQQGRLPTEGLTTHLWYPALSYAVRQ